MQKWTGGGSGPRLLLTKWAAFGLPIITVADGGATARASFCCLRCSLCLPLANQRGGRCLWEVASPSRAHPSCHALLKDCEAPALAFHS